LAGLLEGLSAPTNRARVLRGSTEPGALERTVAEHQTIVDALRSRESQVARAAMLMHVAGVEIWLKQHMAASADQAAEKSPT
jgi:GntR family transcriptional regulator, transcriptional repressor for pyruvate dehydrogenase complex